MLKEIRAVLLDGDETIYKGVGRTDYGLGMQAALNELVSPELFPADHPARTYWASPEFLTDRKKILTDGLCQHKYLGEHYNVDPRTLFEAFHKAIATTVTYDETSLPVINAVTERTLLHTDSSYYWADKRRREMGHTLTINSRSCWADEGFFDHTKMNSDEPAFVGLRRLEVLTGETLTPDVIVVVDDNVHVLARMKNLGFQVVQGLWGGAAPSADFPQTPSAGAYLADVFGLPHPV